MAKKNNRDTKGRIIEAAWSLFYRQGYDDTTVEEIIQELAPPAAPSTTTLRAKTPCSPPCPTSLTGSMRSSPPPWTPSRTALTS